MRTTMGAAAVAAVLVLGCGGDGSGADALDSAMRGGARAGGPGSGPMGGPASGPASGASYEIAFMEGMIDHHQMGIEMAEPCVAGAVHDELRALCADVVETQAAEIAQMQAWLLAWYDVSHEPDADAGTMPMMMPADDLADLSGEDLEIAFMRAMIPHHMQAVRDASRCTARAEHAELVGLCEGIVATQTAEIRSMRTWLCAWYGLCGPGPMRGGMGR